MRKKSKNKQNTRKKTATDKDEDTCPLCGSELIGSDAGIWCMNAACIVEDDADNYR